MSIIKIVLHMSLHKLTCFMEIIFHSHANKTHFHKKGCAPSLILKVRVFGTRKWPIEMEKLQFWI